MEAAGGVQMEGSIEISEVLSTYGGTLLPSMHPTQQKRRSTADTSQ